MDTKSLFCFVLVDLDACTRSTWHYHTLRIAGLVRLLLFDEFPLSLQLNREYQHRLRFEHGPGVTDSQPDPAQDRIHGGALFAAASLAPGPSNAGSTVSSDLAEWLQVGALRRDKIVFNVRQFVQHMAYVRGLVHAGAPKDAMEEGLIAARNDEHRLVLDLTEPMLDLLRQVGHVTRDGLRPLYDIAKQARDAKNGPYPRFIYEDPALTSMD